MFGSDCVGCNALKLGWFVISAVTSFLAATAVLAQEDPLSIPIEENLDVLNQLQERAGIFSAPDLTIPDPTGPVISSEEISPGNDNPYAEFLPETDGNGAQLYGPEPFRRAQQMGQLDESSLAPFIAIAISDPEYGDRILGGSEAPVEDYPWQIALLNARHGTLVCSGSHIGDGWILTAAHCFFDLFGQRIGPNDLLVHHGSNSLLLGSRSRIVDGPYLHKDYNRNTRHYDIAIFRTEILDDNVETNITQPPYLWEISESEIRVSGWGRVTPNGGISTVLLEVNIPIIPNDSCALVMEGSGRGPIIESQICAGRLGADSCNGDSGGPLTVSNGSQRVLVGVVSYGPKQCGNGDPAIYTRVSSHLDWILEITGS